MLLIETNFWVKQFFYCGSLLLLLLISLHSLHRRNRTETSESGTRFENEGVEAPGMKESANFFCFFPFVHGPYSESQPVVGETY